MRNRQDSGISLQPIRPEMQMSLLESTDKFQQQQPDRIIKYHNSSLAQYQSPNQQPILNLIRNQKYSIITFVPIVLYQQFQYFFNLFFLMTALSQFIPVLKVGLLFSFVAPLALVLFLTMIKEAYEDFQRYKKDKQINSATFIKIQAGQRVSTKSSELKVGDILEVGVGESIPADCLLFKSLTDKPSVFIKTDQLDGQTDWKLRKPAIDSINLDSTIIQFTNPVVNIYDFVGSLKMGEELIGLGIQQTLWRGVKVASGRGLIIIIYTGKQTKLSLNSKQAGNKFGQLDHEINFLTKVLFGVMLGLSIIMVLLRGSYGSFGQSFILLFKYFLLLSSIIPISMRVNLDFAKLMYKFMIDNDKLMEGCQCRNSNIPEQLGRISYVLSDKTGTLTQNQMIFRRLMIAADISYESQDTSQIRFLLTGDQKLLSQDELLKKKKVKSMFNSLMLCHNVTPVFDKDIRILQGSSPDQLTLVQFAQHLGFFISQRDEDSIKIVTPSKQQQDYQILQMFPFSSDTKNMGIFVKYNKQIRYYLKGADSVMQNKIPSIDSHFMEEACLDLAREGLRTLVMAEKIISQQFFQAWKKQLNLANASLKNRDQKIAECRARLERGMTFLGVTGVEDRLQGGVVQTIASLRSIGIRVWMLTGDKIETAICVGRAVKLIRGKDQKLFLIENAKSRNQFLEKLDNFYASLNISKEEVLTQDLIKCVLVIDGVSLKWALEEIAQQFFEIAVRLPAIICSRVSPTQKAEVALLVRQFGSGRVLGIGDGGNDVALIQSAHVGVGIYGKQGIQAALASDFSISTFKDLNSLIYWHGRLAYKRSSLLAQFIIHRGIIITIMQTIFTIQFFFVPLPIYNGFLLMGYSSIFTMLPVFSIVLDEDISRDVAMQYPILYKSTQAGNELTVTSFLYWVLISVYQGAIIMILIDIMLGKESFYMVNTISFTCLILIEFLNIFTEIHQVKMLQIVSTLISLVIYVATIFLMRKTLNGVELFSTAYLPATLIIVAAAWCPPFIYQQIMKIADPTEEQKIMGQKKIEDNSQNDPISII